MMMYLCNAVLVVKAVIVGLAGMPEVGQAIAVGAIKARSCEYSKRSAVSDTYTSPCT